MGGDGVIQSKGTSSSFGDVQVEGVGGGGVIHSIRSSSSLREDRGEGVGGDGVERDGVIHSMNEVSSVEQVLMVK